MPDVVALKIGLVSCRQIANVHVGVSYDRTGRIRDHAGDLSILNLCQCDY